MPNYLSSRLRRLASALQRHFVIALLTGVVLGFVVPGLEHVPPPVMVVFLGLLIFVSAFRITLGEMRRIDPVRTALFYLVRFPVLSALLWTITGLVSPALATGVLLLTLAPSGVASPGVAGIYRGNVSLTIVIVVVSSFLAPFMIPLVLELFVARQVEIQTFAIFQTLVVSVIVPIVAHIPFRRFPVADDIRANDSLVVVPAIATLVMLVIAGQKEFIIAHAGEALGFFVTAIILFFGYYAFGWWIYPRSVHRDRIAYALSSGVNNTAIVIVLAYLYFSPEVVTFLVTSELAWVGSMVAFKHLVQRLDHATTG